MKSESGNKYQLPGVVNALWLCFLKGPYLLEIYTETFMDIIIQCQNNPMVEGVGGYGGNKSGCKLMLIDGNRGFNRSAPLLSCRLTFSQRTIIQAPISIHRTQECALPCSEALDSSDPLHSKTQRQVAARQHEAPERSVQRPLEAPTVHRRGNRQIRGPYKPRKLGAQRSQAASVPGLPSQMCDPGIMGFPL